MYAYQIKENGEIIGVAVGKSNAFKFIQKEIDRQGILGYWQGDKYLAQDKTFTIERAIE